VIEHLLFRQGKKIDRDGEGQGGDTRVRGYGMGHGSIYEEDEDNGSSFGDDSRGNSKDMKDSMTNKNQVAQEE
jgi:Neuraminidase (sialidase)